MVTDDTVPMPYGSLLPDLTACRYPNTPEPQYLDKILCPNCSSDNVVGLNPLFNMLDDISRVSSWGRWFCISCYDSWRYEREHLATERRDVV